MAWRSSGTTNDEMVSNLTRFGVISSNTVEQGFRNVDRRIFVPKGHENVAHTDQPLKEGNVHLSAPHIYGSALEALELQTNSSLSFLNVGSGTGYVSCIVADILGPHSSHYGIEIHQDVVTHCKAAIANWKSSHPKAPSIEILCGNGLDVVHTKGESVIGFDRIYVGAAVEKRNLNKLTRLLRPGGILVGPVDDELVKVVRIGSNEEDFTQQVLSGVRFAPLLYFPKVTVVIPSTIWNADIHHSYPDTFRASCKELLLCSSAKVVQQRQQQPSRVNLAAMLPKAVWMEIMSFTHRNWFEPAQSETAFLRQRLLEEQADAQRAHQARLEAEARCHIAERERDVYRLLARRWQNRLQEHLRNNNSNATANDNENDAAAIMLSGREQSVILGLMLRHSHSEEENSDMEEDEDFVDMLAEVAHGDQEDEQLDEGNEDNHSQHSVAMHDNDADDDGDSPMAVSPKDLGSSRSQARTVSISSDDFSG